MPFKKWFSREQDTEEFDPLKNYKLSAMKVGYLVDYDMKTWEVIGYNTYDYDGFVTEEWVLKSVDKVAYLEREDSDGEVAWTLTENISLGKILENVIEHTLKNEDPPETLTLKERRYNLVESGAGLFRKGGEGPGQEFISWSYCDDSERDVLFITQYGERDFKPVVGEYVEEYQFTNVLPSGNV